MKTLWFLSLWFCTDDLKCESYDRFKDQPRQSFEDYSVCLEKTLEIENSGTKVTVNGRQYWLVGGCTEKSK